MTHEEELLAMHRIIKQLLILLGNEARFTTETLILSNVYDTESGANPDGTFTIRLVPKRVDVNVPA